MEFDSINYSITPDTNQDIQKKDLRYNQTVIVGSCIQSFFTGIC